MSRRTLSPALCLVILSGFVRAAPPPIVLTAEAQRLHESLLLIDGHNDMPWELRQRGANVTIPIDLQERQEDLQTDIPRLRQGGVGAQFWSVWVPNDTAYDGTALSTTLEQIELVKTFVARYPDTFELALTADDIERIHAGGKIASLIGVEGGYSIEESISVLHRLYELGARYMTLTHSDNLSWADSATDKPQHHGLTPFGEDVVREMNKLGMMVDLSHVSANTMKHALRITKAPVIFSHSSARAIADHPRNVPDEVLKMLPANGGIVMVNFFSGFTVPEAADNYARLFAIRKRLRESNTVKEEVDAELARWRKNNPMPKGTIHVVLDHIEHIAEIAGIDHVGLGSDFDGVSVLPDQLQDVSYYPYLTQGLLDRGYSEAEIRKVHGGNLLRVMRQVEAMAE